MARTLSDLVTQIEDIEPRVDGKAGTRELAEALVVASTALVDVLDDLQGEIRKNNKLLHDMIHVLASRSEPE